MIQQLKPTVILIVLRIGLAEELHVHDFISEFKVLELVLHLLVGPVFLF
jgi:hypothetical protein